MKPHIRKALRKKYNAEEIKELERTLTEKEIEKLVAPSGTAVLIVIALMIGVGYWMFSGDDEPEVVLTKTELHKQNIEKAFHPWDGSHINLEKMIIKALNDPESYTHVETTYRDLDSVLIVSSEFTAKNAMGGTLRKTVIVKADTLGNVLEVIQWMN